MGQPQGAAPHLRSNCRMKLLPQQVWSSMGLLSNVQQKKKGKRTKVEAAIGSMTKAFYQSRREADENG